MNGTVITLDLLRHRQ